MNKDTLKGIIEIIEAIADRAEKLKSFITINVYVSIVDERKKEEKKDG